MLKLQNLYAVGGRKIAVKIAQDASMKSEQIECGHYKKDTIQPAKGVEYLWHTDDNKMNDKKFSHK